MPKKSVALVAVAFAITLMSSGCDRMTHYTEQEHIQRAKDFEDKGNLKSSIIELKNVLQKNPNNPQARLLLGQIYLKAGMAAEAEKELSQAEKLGVSSEFITPLRGEALIQMGEYKRVLDEIQPGTQVSGTNLARIQQLRADALFRQGQVKDACNLYQQSLDTDTGHPPTYWGLAQCAMVDHDTAKAREWLNTANKIAPRNVKNWIVYGDFERFIGNAQGAESAYTQALTIAPNTELALANRALTRFSQGQNPAAQEDLDRLRAIAPKGVTTTFLDAVAHYHAGKLNDSLNMLLQVERTRLGALPTLRLLGIVQYKLGNFEQASQHLTRYLEQSPGDLEVRKLLAAVYLQMNQPKRALTALQSVLTLDKPDSQVLALASAAHLRSHDLAESTRLLQQAITLQPENVTLRTQLGLNLWASGDKQEAQKALENAASHDQQQYKADLALVLTFLQQQQFDRALDAVNNLEKKRPNDPLTFNLKGATYLGLKDFAHARKYFEQALVLQPSSATAALNLAQLDLRDKNPAAAKLRFERILTLDKNSLQAMLGMAGLAASAGREREYVGWLDKALRLTPPALQPRLLLSKYYLAKNQTQKALDMAREAQAAYPNHPAALEQFAIAQLRSGQTDNALISFKKIVELVPGSASAYVKLASVQATLGKRDAARASLQKALALSPAYLEAQIALIALEMQTGKHQEAMAVVRRIKVQRPSFSIGTILEGDVAIAQKQYAQAADAYRRAWGMDKNGAIAIKLHQALTGMTRIKEADSFLQQWVDARPQDIQARLYLARVYTARGERKLAISQYQAVLKQNPNQLAVMNNLALLYQDERDPRARTIAEQAYKLNPDNPALSDTLGWVLFQQGEIGRGGDLIQAAARIAPQNAEIRYHMAVVLARSGKTAEARKVLQALLATSTAFPQREAAQALLKTL